MEQRNRIGDVILWLDDSPDSLEAKKIITETGVQFVERIVTDPAEKEAIQPPTLQLPTYSLSGLTMIKAVSTYPHESLQTQIDSDRARAYIEI